MRLKDLCWVPLFSLYTYITISVSADFNVGLTVSANSSFGFLQPYESFSSAIFIFSCLTGVYVYIDTLQYFMFCDTVYFFKSIVYRKRFVAVINVELFKPLTAR